MSYARTLASLVLAACLMAGGGIGADLSQPADHADRARIRPAAQPTRFRASSRTSMSQSLGQQLVIENIGGAGGMIAAARAARATPDGYTILDPSGGAGGVGMTLYPNLTFDAEKDFVPIGLINTAASAWSARADLPPNNIAEHGALDEGARTQRQGRASRRRLVRSSGRRAGRTGVRRGGHPGALSRRGSGAQRPAGGPGRHELAVGCAGRPAGQVRQAQGLRHHRTNPVRRPARSADHGRARLQEARARFLAHAARARAARRVRSSIG